VRRAVERGLLERRGPHTYVVAGAPRTWRQRLVGGSLDLGDGAVVAGRSAAALLGLDAFVAAPVEFLVPRRNRNRRTDGVVRSVGRVPQIDVVRVEDLPCTSGARTVVDLAGLVTTRELEDAIDSAIRSGWTSERFLRERLGVLRHRGRAGVRHLDRAMSDAGGHTRLERGFLQLVRRGGLPRPACQVIQRAAGRVIARTDFSWAPAKIVVEVAGQERHASPRERQRDAQRHTELQVTGWVVLTFTYEDVVERPEWVLRMVRRALSSNASRDLVRTTRNRD
jgi:very-short-patch-repair endonuclease